MIKNEYDISDELVEFAGKEVNRILDSDPVKSHREKFGNIDLKIDMIVCHESEYFNFEMDRLKNIKGFTEDDVHETILDDIENRHYLSTKVPAMANCSYGIINDGILVCNHVVIYVSLDDICRTLFRNPGKEDVVLRYFTLMVGHELGHMIDYIMKSGMTNDEFDQQEEDETRIDKEVHKKMEEYRNREWKGVTQEDVKYVCNMMYYNEIPAERRANEYAGFTNEELEEIYHQCGLN